MTNATQEQFLLSGAGQRFNPDGAYGTQCKDVADAYALALFGDWVHTVRPGNGAQVFDQASPDYFQKVRNNPAAPDQLPPRGAICSWTGTPAVPEGHVNICLAATPGQGTFLEQDGYTDNDGDGLADGAAYVATYPWQLPTGAQLIGWLIPLVPDDKPTQCVVESGDTMWSIAVQFGVSLQGLIDANPQVPNPNLIQPGQVLTLP